MVKMLNRPTLILNRNWQPVNVATVARALVLLWNEAARVADPDTYQLSPGLIGRRSRRATAMPSSRRCVCGCACPR
jgi:hypothetical protein